MNSLKYLFLNNEKNIIIFNLKKIYIKFSLIFFLFYILFFFIRTGTNKFRIPWFGFFLFTIFI